MGLEKKNNTTENDSAIYKLGYFQGISDLMCEIHSLSPTNNVNFNGYNLAFDDKCKLVNTICGCISEKASKLMQKNGKTDFLNYMKVIQQTK